MKFTVSSATLLNHLQTVSKVIASKNTMAILDNFLLEISGNKLTLTASDLETTISSSLDIEGSGEEVAIALPARLLTDTLKEFPDQPLTFDINTQTLAVEFTTETSEFNFIGQNGNDFPKKPEFISEVHTAQVDAPVLAAGINKTAFATAVDDARPAMTGIFFLFQPGRISFVATDAHKLVRLTNNLEGSDLEASFILPKKSANVMKGMLAGEDAPVTVSFDDKNIVFDLPNYQVICRKIEGKYPNYEQVIPQNNPYEVIVDRASFANALKRVSTFANKSTNLIKISISTGMINLSAQDIDFSISAQEKITCQYEGEPIRIGFRASHLVDILNSFDADEVRLKLADPSRAGIVLPYENADGEDLLMLLMPLLIND